MKKTVTFVGLLFTLVLVQACKKDKEEAPAPSVVGFWVGKYGNGSNAADLDYAFLFRADGTLKIYANNADTAAATKATGTYWISGTKVNTTFTYSNNLKYSSASTADANFTTMSGTWGSGTVTTGNTFYLNKR